MYDQDSQEPDGNSQDGNDLGNRVNGLMSSLGKRTNERDAALARAAELERQLAEAQAALESRPEPYIDKNRVRSSYPTPDPMDAVKNASWESFGFRDPNR